MKTCMMDVHGSNLFTSTFKRGLKARNFTEGNARKFTVSFAFCAHVDVIKISKNTGVFLQACADYLTFRPQRECDRKTIVRHLKVTP